GPYAAAVTFEIYPPVVIHPPVPLEPIGRAVVATFTPKLRVRNSVRSGPAGPIVYSFQLSDNETFTAIVASGSVGESGGETEFNPGVALTPNNDYYWRARASDGEVTTDWTATQVFTTPGAPPPPPPGGGGGGASCGSREPIDIVTCHRARYPALLSPADAPNLLRDIAADLNRGRSPFYGRLRKTSGNNCAGYACDIICAVDGRHWDVFIDGPDAGSNYSGAATPAWIDKGFVDPSRCELVP
ncbi:MAG TPA: hypothetical protein VNI83_16225, partial [Vicinamibacterales bacterium]|nr:hypothetical protein [Vicinamibacterales bacterium]